MGRLSKEKMVVEEAEKYYKAEDVNNNKKKKKVELKKYAYNLRNMIRDENFGSSRDDKKINEAIDWLIQCLEEEEEWNQASHVSNNNYKNNNKMKVVGEEGTTRTTMQVTREIPDIYFAMLGDKVEKLYAIHSSSSSSSASLLPSTCSRTIRRLKVALPRVPEHIAGSKFAAIGSKIYASGGKDLSYPLVREHFVYTLYATSNKVFSIDTLHPEEGWKSEPPMNAPRMGHYMLADSGKLYVLGGLNLRQFPIISKDGKHVFAEVYDPLNPNCGWQQLARPSVDGIKLPQIICGHAIRDDGPLDRKILFHTHRHRNMYYLMTTQLDGFGVYDDSFVPLHCSSAFLDGILYLISDDSVDAYDSSSCKLHRVVLRDVKSNTLPHQVCGGLRLLSLGNKCLALIWTEEPDEVYYEKFLNVHCSIIEMSRDGDLFVGRVLNSSTYSVECGDLVACMAVCSLKEDVSLDVERGRGLDNQQLKHGKNQQQHKRKWYQIVETKMKVVGEEGITRTTMQQQRVTREIPDIYFAMLGDKVEKLYAIQSSSSSSSASLLPSTCSRTTGIIRRLKVALPPVPESIAESKFAAIGSKIYASGGNDLSYPLFREHSFYTVYPSSNKVFSIDTLHPEEGWKAEPRMNAPRTGHYMLADSGKLYVLGGLNLREFPIISKDGKRVFAEAYDPLNPNCGWQQLARPSVDGIQLPQTICGHAIRDDGPLDRKILFHTIRHRNMYYLKTTQLDDFGVYDDSFVPFHSSSAFLDGILYLLSDDSVDAYDSSSCKLHRVVLRDVKSNTLPHQACGGLHLLSLGNKCLALIWAEEPDEVYYEKFLNVHCSIIEMSRDGDLFVGRVLNSSTYSVECGELVACMAVCSLKEDVSLDVERGRDLDNQQLKHGKNQQQHKRKWYQIVETN